MITLSPLETKFLEALFRDIPDRMLIRELVRRERFGQVRATVTIDGDAMADAKYPYNKVMNEQLGIMMGRQLAKHTERGYVVTEYPHPNNSYRIHSRTLRCADAVFLRTPPTSFEPDNDGTQHAKPTHDRQTGHDNLLVEDRVDSLGNFKPPR